MERGNISNAPVPKVGVRFEAIIYNFGKVNQPGKAFCEDLLHKDLRLLQITCLPKRKVMAWCMKWAIPYNEVIEAASPIEIPEICFEHRLRAYYDTDDRLLEQVGLRGNPRTQAIKWSQPLDEHTKSTAHKTS